MRKITKKEEKWVTKVKESLEIGGNSKRTINNYLCAINRFLDFFENDDIKNLKEEDIVKYLKKKYIDKGFSGQTYNVNIAAISYFFSVCFEKEFNKKRLPKAKCRITLPITLDKKIFLEIFNGEKNPKYKCWFLLAFCSGLRVEEIAKIKIEDINAKEHKLKVVGKRNKERFTILPNITIKYLRIYYKQCNFKKKNGYLFEGCAEREYMNCKHIINYFSLLKKKYNLSDQISFHSLRHSFATNFIKAGGDPFVLKSMMGHQSLNTTSIYIHLGRDFNNISGIKHDQV